MQGPWSYYYGVDDYLQSLRIKESIRIEIVCLGNICRSPMAAAVLSARAAEIYPKQLSVTSSGTSPAHYGEGAHPLSEKVWQQAGYRYEHRARGFNSQIFQEADLILAMDFDNHENILKRAERSDSRSKVMMLRSFDKTATSLEIPDPWGLGIASYQEVLEMVEASVSGLLQRLSGDTI